MFNHVLMRQSSSLLATLQNAAHNYDLNKNIKHSRHLVTMSTSVEKRNGLPHVSIHGTKYVFRTCLEAA